MPRFLRLVLVTACVIFFITPASQAATNYYTYTSAATSGAWNAAGTWTTDPSGVSLVGSAVPATGDAVFILNGFTVLLTTNVATTGHSITINNGGTLDLAAFTITTLSSLAGSGTLKIRQGYFPAVSVGFNSFVNNAASGATVEYADADGNIPASLNFPNLRFTSSSGSHAISFSNSVAYTLNVYGTFTTIATGGSLTVTIGTQKTNTIGMVIGGSVAIGANTTWTTATITDASVHAVSIAGDMTNNGTVIFNNNGTQYATTNTGAATLKFVGTTNNVLVCNNVTRLHTITVDKGTSSTYILSVTSTNVANFRLWAHSTGVIILLNVVNGTLRLGANINLTHIQSSGNYELGSDDTSPMLWIDGAIVDAFSSALVVYGKFRITAGSFTTMGTEGSVIRYEGQYLIEGGTFTTEKFRPSTTEPDHRGSFIMSGGTFNAIGTIKSNANYARFSQPFKDQVFVMTGGTINVINPQSGNEAGIHIGVKESNYTVTGGTVNAIVSGPAAAFRILSTVPFYDLNISLSSGTPTTAILTDIPMTGATGQSAMTTTAQPLRILNSLTIGSAVSGDTPTLNANGQDVVVGGNFTINSGSTYTPGSNTTLFNGAAGQQFNDNQTTSPGLYKMSVDKSGGTLTLGGTASSLSVANMLTLSNGVLNDGGKTILAKGNIANSATHTGTGNITLSGTTTQRLSGDGNGIYGNVVLNNSVDPGVTATANLSISGTLTLAGTGNSLFDINQYRLSMTSSSATALIWTGSAFSNTKMIRTLGLQSDGGLRKTFGNLSAFTYAVGAGIGLASVYTPAVIQLTALPTSYGSITVKPVNSRDPFVAPGNITNLQWYWRVSSAGFVGATTFTHKYYYAESSVNPGGDDATYVPARYAPTAWTVINDLTKVNETTNEITFAGVNYVDGDFTAGLPAAFGIVKVFYSKRSGDWNNTTAGVTPWSNVSHSGADAIVAPGAGDQVYIGDGGIYNHTITVTAPNARAGGLEISSGSTLDVGVSVGHNFGGLEDAPVGGSGTLRISSSAGTAAFPAGDFGNFIRASGGTVVYYTTGVSFTIPLSSASPTLLPLITYRYLRLQPAGTNTITLPNQDVRVFNDMTVQGNVATALARLNGSAVRSFDINGNLSITGGTLQFQNGFAQSMDVDGNISVSSGAAFNVATSGTVVAHTLSIAGNVTNNGTFDLNNTGICNATFDGAASASITGTGTTTDFNVLTVSKGTSSTPVLDVNASNFTLSNGTTPLILTSGTFRLTSAQTVPIANGADFNIPISARLSANGGTLQLIGVSGIDLLLAGTLEVLNGAINVGITAGDNSIEYAATGLPTITVSGGTLNVQAQVRRSAANAQGTLAYNQSGASTVNVGISSATTLTRSLFEVFGSGSSFTMSGGLLSLQHDVSNLPTTSATIELFLQPSVFNVTGGTIQAAGGALIEIYTTIPLFNAGVIGSSTAKLQGNALTLRGSLSIAAGSVFNANSLNVSVAGDFSNADPSNGVGLASGGYRPVGSSQTTTFNGSAGSQNVTGAAGNVTNFANLVINNTFSGGVVALQPNSNLYVSGNLILSSGTLAGNANTIRVLGTVSNSSTHTSTPTGSITLVSGSLQLITGNGSGKFGNLILNSGATYLGANQEITGTLTLFNNKVFTLGSYGLTLSNTSMSAIAGANAATYLATSGNLSDGGVTKSFAASASGTFTFPIGVSGKYTPAAYTIDNGATAGTITIRPVNSKHPNATGTGTAYLRYYWRVNTSGLAVNTLTQKYTYSDLDINGTESDYRDARFFGGLWSVGVTAGNPVLATNVITFTNNTNIASDYTAGEQLAFVPATTYTSIANGPWETQSLWMPDPGSASGPPPGSFIIIGLGTTVTVGTSGKSMATMSVQGTLALGATNSHNFGTVTAAGAGNRTLQLQSSFFPAGDFSQFNSATGGTVEYNGAMTLSATQATYNNLSFTGTGVKELGNIDLTVNGNITIAAGTVNNTVNSTINMVNSAADFTNSGTFNAGSGPITIGRDLVNVAGTFNAPNSTTGLKIARNLTNALGATFVSGTDSIGVRGTLANGGTFTAGANAIRISGNLQNTAGTFNAAAGTLSVGGSLTNNAAFKAAAGAIDVQGQLVNSGATAVYTANANSLFVKGAINLTTGSGFNAGTGTITTNGDWNNSATFTRGTGTVNFTSSVNQNVTGATNFYNVSRSGGDLTLNNDVTMSGVLSLSTGNVLASTHVLSLTNPSTQPVTGYSTSAYIDGGLSISYPSTPLATRVYPIASGGAYRPVTIQQTLTSGNPVVRVRMTNVAPTGVPPTDVDRISQARYYAIDLLSGSMESPIIDLSFNTNGTADETITTPTNARVLRSTTPSGPWTSEGGSGVFSPADPAGHVTSAVTSIGGNTYFTLGYPNAVPQPVTLVLFDAVLSSDLVELSWITASEKDNDYFTIERSNENLQFDSLFTVVGAGNSLELLHYSAIDYAPLYGVSFYRLRQTDFDQKYSFSKVVRVVNNHRSTQILSLYPNPARENESVHLKLNAPNGNQSNLTITDALGRLYFAGSIDLSKAIDLKELALQYHLAPGTYLIRISWGGNVEARKLIVH